MKSHEDFDDKEIQLFEEIYAKVDELEDLTYKNRRTLTQLL